MYLFTDKRLYYYKFDREMTEVTGVFPWFSKSENGSDNNHGLEDELNNEEALCVLYNRRVFWKRY